MPIWPFSVFFHGRNAKVRSERQAALAALRKHLMEKPLNMGLFGCQDQFLAQNFTLNTMVCSDLSGKAVFGSFCGVRVGGLIGGNLVEPFFTGGLPRSVARWKGLEKCCL